MNSEDEFNEKPQHNEPQEDLQKEPTEELTEEQQETTAERPPDIRRLHPAAMLVGAVKSLRQWVSAVAFYGVFTLVREGLSFWTIILIGAGVFVVVVLSALWGVLAWRATTYDVSGGSFRLRDGVIQKNERTIPLEHVQSVDTVQGILQRLFGVYEVRVETAGGGVAEPDAALSALDRSAVERLRWEIEGSRTVPEVGIESSGPTVIRKLSMRNLLIAGATSGQIGVALSLVAIGSQFADNLFSEMFVERVFETLAPSSVSTILVLILLVALFAWFLAIAGTVLAYSGFTLSRDGDFLYIRRGLLERREATIPLARIQAVRIVEGVLRRPFGLAMLRVESAGYGEDAGVSTTLFPLIPRRQAQALLEAAAPEFAVQPRLERLPRRARRRYAIRATIPVLFLAAAAAAPIYLNLDSVAFAALPLSLILPAIVIGLLQYRAAGFALADDRLVVRSGSISRTTTIAPRRRLQSRASLRSPFQRRIRLATFEAQVASGGGGSHLRVVDLEHHSAQSLLQDLGPTVQRSS